MTSLRSVSLEEFLRLDEVILIDCEFTCWEDSLRTRWADPVRPPEVIEIGLARYALAGDRPAERFTCLVRPRVSPELSAYCRDLLRLPQAALDEAPSLAEAIGRVAVWLDAVSPRTPTCGWGRIDREFLATDVARSTRRCPFEGRAHADLKALCERVLGRGPGTRDELRAHWRLAPNAGRHRALDDAVDLAQFCARVRALASGFAGA